MSSIGRIRWLMLAGALAPNLQATGAQPPDARPTIAVMYFNNNSLVDHASYDPLSKGVADILSTSLATNARVRVVERDQLQRILEEQNLAREGRVEDATAARIGHLLGAQHIIVGGFLLDRGGAVSLDARVVHVETGRILHGETSEGKAEDLLPIIRNLASTLSRRLNLGETRAPSREARGANRWMALLTYSRALVEDDLKNVTVAVDLYQRFLNETTVDFAVDQRKKATLRIRDMKGGT